MELRYIGKESSTFTKGKLYKILGSHNGSDGSMCLDIYSLVTVTGKFANRFSVVCDAGFECYPTVNNFDLSPIKKAKMNKLQKIIAENYFTEDKKKAIAEVGLKLQKAIKDKKNELDELERIFESLGDAVDLGDAESIESALSYKF